MCTSRFSAKTMNEEKSQLWQDRIRNIGDSKILKEVENSMNEYLRKSDQEIRSNNHKTSKNKVR